GRAIPGAPETAYTHRGAGNNIVYVDRENDLVIVMRWVRGNAINPFIGQVLGSLVP
ncbi:MAG: serine hydrolase, partial [Gemmatimonadales bacterium]|nr:serine hydrolase [Gemmatimonadales bacterium]